VIHDVETIEKVDLDRILPVGRKCNLSRCSVCDDLTLRRGQDTPENHPVIVLMGFFHSLVSSPGG
jgi:hypothetical protein